MGARLDEVLHRVRRVFPEGVYSTLTGFLGMVSYSFIDI